MDMQDQIDQMSKMSTDEIIDATAKLRAENALREEALDAMKDYSKSVTLATLYGTAPYVDYSSLVTTPGSTITGTSISYPVYTQQTFAVDSTMFEEERAKDRKLQLKLFIHFAKLFVEKYPKWQLLPEADDPFNKVKLVRPDLGVSITSLYPMNELAVYGGPDLWMTGLRELGQTLPIVKVTPQTFFGWALDIDTPEWVR